MYNYMYLCTNKGKNMTKITIRLMIPILRIQVLWPVMLTNLQQNLKKYTRLTVGQLKYACNFTKKISSAGGELSYETHRTGRLQSL